MQAADDCRRRTLFEHTNSIACEIIMALNSRRISRVADGVLEKIPLYRFRRM